MKKISFALSLLFFWIKGHLELDGHFIKVSTANTILGFIPAGRNSYNIPLKNVGSSNISTSYNFIQLIIGTLVVLSGFSGLGESFFGSLIIMAFGLLIFGSGIRTVLTINAAGVERSISVPFYEKNKILNFMNAINEFLAKDIDKTDLGFYFNQKTQE